MCCANTISTYTPYITGFGGVITGAIGSFFVGVLLSQRNHDKAIALMRRQEFIKAAINFRSAFFDLLIFCQHQPTGSGADSQVADFIIKDIPDQIKAALLFRAFLDSSQRSSFDNAWKEYSQQENWNEFKTESIVSEYRVVFFDQTAEKDKCHLMASRVENLFSFAPLQ